MYYIVYPKNTTQNNQVVKKHVKPVQMVKFHTNTHISISIYVFIPYIWCIPVVKDIRFVQMIAAVIKLFKNQVNCAKKQLWLSLFYKRVP